MPCSNWPSVLANLCQRLTLQLQARTEFATCFGQVSWKSGKERMIQLFAKADSQRISLAGNRKRNESAFVHANLFSNITPSQIDAEYRANFWHQLLILRPTSGTEIWSELPFFDDRLRLSLMLSHLCRQWEKFKHTSDPRVYRNIMESQAHSLIQASDCYMVINNTIDVFLCIYIHALTHSATSTQTHK